MSRKYIAQIFIFVLSCFVVCNYMWVHKLVKDLNDYIEKQDLVISKMEYEINNINDYNKKLVERIETVEFEIEELSKVILELETKIEKINTNTVKATNAKSVATKSSGTTMTFEATAYSGDPITATGTVPKVGRTIAVDPKVIPYGTQVYIEGMGTYTAEDCGGAIKGNIIDIFMATKEECRAWGRRKVQIQILK